MPRRVDLANDNVKHITLQYVGCGPHYELRHFQISESRPKLDKTEPRPKIELVQVINNVRSVSTKILEPMLESHGFALAAVYFTQEMKPPRLPTDKEMIQFTVRVVFKKTTDLGNKQVEFMELTDDQRWEIKRLMNLTVAQYCNARYYGAAVPHIQVRLDQNLPKTKSPLFLTIRDNELMVVPTEALNDVERDNSTKELEKKSNPVYSKLINKLTKHSSSVLL